MIQFAHIGLILSKKCQSLIVLEIQRVFRPSMFFFEIQK